MRKAAYSVAVVGATGLVGREIIEVLEQRRFPLADLQLYASVRSAGDEVRCGSVSTRVELLDGARFSDTDLVFLAASEQVSAEWVRRITDSGAVVIDTSQLFAGDAEVPLIVPEVNSAALAGYADHGLITSPDPPAIALGVALAPLHTAATIKRVVACSLEAASGAGGPGLDELRRQTVELMSGRSVEPGVFPRRIAFNVVPQVGELLAGGWSGHELQTANALRRLLGDPELTVQVTRVRVPLFYGAGISANVETVDHLTVAQTEEILRTAPGGLLQDGAAPHTYPTPADAVGQEAIGVGRIRADDGTNVVDLWITIDNIRKGAAVNAVQIAEGLVGDYL